MGLLIRVQPEVNGARLRRVGGGTTACLALGLFCVLLSGAACQRSTLPRAMSDREFWRLVETLSEPPGAFTLSDNLVSNEPRFAERIRWLHPTGGVYVGVGPEQNFSYIARLRPALAFVIDIRRENRNLHLLYKALFELSVDRPDFVSRLFSRPRPPDLEAAASVDDIFTRYDRVAPSRELYAKNRMLVRERLLAVRGFPLSEVDLEEIDRALSAFYQDGPEIHFWGSRTEETAPLSYRLLMTARDSTGRSRSYLATPEGFRFVKDLHSKNRIVPVVGDFGGPSALRRMGEYVREHADVIQAFYGSNVGVYLTKQQMRAFCGNLATLPVARPALFIENNGMRSFASKLRACEIASRPLE
jgi:hypothetical protein